jgi:hypothetical protein
MAQDGPFDSRKSSKFNKDSQMEQVTTTKKYLKTTMTKCLISINLLIYTTFS